VSFLNTNHLDWGFQGGFSAGLSLLIGLDKWNNERFSVVSADLELSSADRAIHWRHTTFTYTWDLKRPFASWISSASSQTWLGLSTSLVLFRSTPTDNKLLWSRAETCTSIESWFNIYPGTSVVCSDLNNSV